MLIAGPIKRLGELTGEDWDFTINVNTKTDFDAILAESAERIEKIQEELNELSWEELPSEGLKESVQNIIDRMKELQEESKKAKDEADNVVAGGGRGGRGGRGAGRGVGAGGGEAPELGARAKAMKSYTDQLIAAQLQEDLFFEKHLYPAIVFVAIVAFSGIVLADSFPHFTVDAMCDKADVIIEGTCLGKNSVRIDRINKDSPFLKKDAKEIEIAQLDKHDRFLWDWPKDKRKVIATSKLVLFLVHNKEAGTWKSISTIDADDGCGSAQADGRHQQGDHHGHEQYREALGPAPEPVDDGVLVELPGHPPNGQAHEEADYARGQAEGQEGSDRADVVGVRDVHDQHDDREQHEEDHEGHEVHHHRARIHPEPLPMDASLGLEAGLGPPHVTLRLAGPPLPPIGVPRHVKARQEGEDEPQQVHHAFHGDRMAPLAISWFSEGTSPPSIHT